MTACTLSPAAFLRALGFPQSKEKGAPFPAALQYRVDAWSERSKPLFQLQVLKIRLILCPRIEDISDIKLIRTDTTLDLSQKAEKVCFEVTRYDPKMGSKENSFMGSKPRRWLDGFFLCMGSKPRRWLDRFFPCMTISVSEAVPH